MNWKNDEMEDGKWIDDNRKGDFVSTTIKFGKFKLVVHKYIGMGDALFASCNGFFEMMTLHSEDLEKAKEEAVSLFKGVLKETTIAYKKYKESIK